VTIEVEIDRDVCMGSGNCTHVARGAFALDADEIAVVVDPAAATEEQLVDAARRCPTHAISIRRTSS
jgi:ferredoxin